ncbi:unnamed protein product [Albugo candida]|uniref:Uncharacterized protein n=1 Tax=Albugo candida TaxID=65357 RepID=A0A024GVY9_9STRA|nr:unnamed protein product [Albugo candida]|eukprot:CCI50718.1 unnamed protein product [Albugo candida]
MKALPIAIRLKNRTFFAAALSLASSRYAKYHVSKSSNQVWLERCASQFCMHDCHISNSTRSGDESHHLNLYRSGTLMLKRFEADSCVAQNKIITRYQLGVRRNLVYLTALIKVHSSSSKSFEDIKLVYQNTMILNEWIFEYFAHEPKEASSSMGNV